VEPFLPDGRRRQHRTARLRAPRRGDANLRAVITGKVRRIHLRRPDLGVSKRPITPIRAQRVPINRLDKPKSWPAPHRSGDEPGRSPRLSNTPQTVTRSLMEVIRCTPVRNKA
jgi:hypothetical protein